MLKKTKNRIYTISIVCDDEITTDVIQLFKFSTVNFKKIKTQGAFGTELVVEMKKD